jgi:Resolvase, N terminal domain
MTGRHNRAAIYLRVSRGDQTTENQRLVLARVAQYRGWMIVQTYEDQGINHLLGLQSVCCGANQKVGTHRFAQAHVRAELWSAQPELARFTARGQQSARGG